MRRITMQRQYGGCILNWAKPQSHSDNLSEKEEKVGKRNQNIAPIFVNTKVTHLVVNNLHWPK
jgi:hypothetical protein